MLHQAARQAAIQVVLAAQAYQRENGTFPENLQQLVPEFLEAIPLAPCDSAGGQVLYRRESVTEAIVWSVGSDGIDDLGKLAAVENGTSIKYFDVGFTIRKPE